MKITMKRTRGRKNTNKQLIGLIDGDIYIYKASAVSEEVVHWKDDIWTVHASYEEAKNNLDEMFYNIQEKTGVNGIMVALSDNRGNFRNDIYRDYKSNRKNIRPPILKNKLREYIKTNYVTYLEPYLEADDVLGILATDLKEGKNKIIISEDKDLMTIPGMFYSTRTDQIKKISEREADYHFLFQALTGDTTDGYPGCPSIGPKRANEVLEGMLEESEETYLFKKYWEKVEDTFVKNGLSKEDALTQARLARICRYNDYDFERKMVKLWRP